MAAGKLHGRLGRLLAQKFAAALKFKTITPISEEIVA
jgi:hypothetical protein